MLIISTASNGKPVDIWAMGVIVYFLLRGYRPFDLGNEQEEIKAICAGRYSFEPKEHWLDVSETACHFVRTMLTMKPTKRPTAERALEHPWVISPGPHFVAIPSSSITSSLYRLSIISKDAAKEAHSYQAPNVVYRI